MTTNIQRAFVVARHVEIRSVTLVSASANSSLDSMEPASDLVPSQRYRAVHVLRSDHPDCVFVEIEFQFDALAEADESSESVSLKATYRLVYELKDAETYPEDALEHFADLNGTYNAWPYWREMVQTVTGRLGAPGVVIPVFRPTSVELPEDDEEEE